MIKKTFYNLPTEKQSRVKKAIFCEFTTHPQDKISINRIIKMANISRGSFYQYFDDKVDLIEVVIKEIFDNIIKKSLNIIEEINGDVFLFYINFFNFIITYAENEKEKALFKNLAESFKANDDLFSEFMKNRFQNPENNKIIFYKIDRSQLKNKDDFELKCIIEILNQILKNSVFDIFVVNEDVFSIEKRFIRKIEIVKAGVTI